MILAGWAILKIDANYSAFAARVDSTIGPMLMLLGYQLPLTAAEAFTLLNLVALLSWFLVKLALVSVVDAGGLVGWEGASEVAYRRREGRWLMKPWWLSAKLIGPALAACGVALLAWQWWEIDGSSFTGWVRALPGALIAVGIEWWLWLSGEVDDHVEPEFAGGADDGGQSVALFEDLWGRYRRMWPENWRAAGNRAPVTPDG